MNIKLTGLLFIAFLFSTQLSFGQQPNTVITDSKLHKDVLVGFCNRNGLKSGLFGEYFKSQYEAYKPNAALVKKIAEKIDKVKITIIFGSWCGDSKIQVPRFYKILDRAHYNENNIKLIAVDRSMRAMTVDITDLNIERIPTFIIYQGDKELGRIVESPGKSLEKDLYKILKKVR